MFLRNPLFLGVIFYRNKGLALFEDILWGRSRQPKGNQPFGVPFWMKHRCWKSWACSLHSCRSTWKPKNDCLGGISRDPGLHDDLQGSSFPIIDDHDVSEGSEVKPGFTRHALAVVTLSRFPEAVLLASHCVHSVDRDQ